jgi:hypothetical protein
MRTKDRAKGTVKRAKQAAEGKARRVRQAAATAANGPRLPRPGTKQARAVKAYRAPSTGQKPARVPEGAGIPFQPLCPLSAVPDYLVNSPPASEQPD